MIWDVEYIPEAQQDFDRLDGSQKKIVRKAIEKVRQNPLPVEEGGYGKPLGNKDGHNLTGLLKIKILAAGIRIVYKLEPQGEIMVLVVIGMRGDDEVYEIAEKRK